MESKQIVNEHKKVPKNHDSPAVWFPTIQTHTGTDLFTERLAKALQERGFKTQITWLPHRAEYAPWTIPIPNPPDWVNIVHTNSWLHTRFLPADLPLVVTLHSCVHDPALQPYKSQLQHLYHRFWVKRLEAGAMRKATAITAVSHYAANRAATIFGCPNVAPIHNWIDTGKFRPDARKTPHSPFRLLFIGKLRRLKGADLLPEIMRRLGKDFELRFTGEKLAFGAQDEIPENMISIGWLSGNEALLAAYRNSDALLFPTRLEGFGLVAAEAIACGLPVITSDNTALPEVVKEGETGFLCPTDDVEEFVKAIQTLRDETALWQVMRSNCVRYAELHFNEDIQVGKYLALYRSHLPL